MFQNVNECVSQPCLNNGKCEDKIGGFECHCVGGYFGNNCEKYGTDCDSLNCPSFAECNEVNGIASCACKSEFPGGYIIVFVLLNDNTLNYR